MLNAHAELIGRIYESAADPAGVDAVLEDMVRATNSGCMIFGLFDEKRGEPMAARMIGDVTSRRADGMRAFTAGETIHDPTIAFCMSRPGDRMFATHRAMTADEHARHPHMAWNRHYMQSSHWLARISEREGLGLVASLHPGDAAGHHANDDSVLFGALFDHVARAHRIATRRAPDGDAAVINLDVAGRVIRATPSAEALLVANDGLRSRDARLVADAPSAQRALTRAVADALSPIDPRGRMLTISRPSGRRALVLAIDPIPVAMGFAGFAPGARVLMVDPASGSGMLGPRLAGWDLTPAEARFAVQLVETGFDLRGAATRLNISYATARTHLARIFLKTETRSQPELMRLLTQLSG